MDLVIDANIVISMLIKPGLPIDLLFNKNLKVYAPKFLFEELDNNKQLIIRKSKLEEYGIEKLFSILKTKIIIVHEREFRIFRDKAEEICPDSKDVIYFALALYLKLSIWSNEKKLKNQDKIKVYATHELLSYFNP